MVDSDENNDEWGFSSSPWGYPYSWMVYFMGNPMKMDDDLGVPLFF